VVLTEGLGWEVDRTESGSCPVTGFDMNSVGAIMSLLTELANNNLQQGNTAVILSLQLFHLQCLTEFFL
jgi:hypothetical protein